MAPQEIKELAVAEQPVQFERELLAYYTFGAGDDQLKNTKKSLPSKGSQGGFDLVESEKKEFKPEPCEDRFGEPNRAFLFDGVTNSITSGRGGTRKERDGSTGGCSEGRTGCGGGGWQRAFAACRCAKGVGGAEAHLRGERG